MITSSQTTKAEFSTFVVVLVFRLLNRKVLLMNKKDNRNKICKIINSWDPNFLGYF